MKLYIKLYMQISHYHSRTLILFKGCIVKFNLTKNAFKKFQFYDYRTERRNWF